MGYFRPNNGNFRGYFVSLWGLWRDMRHSLVNANLICVGDNAFGCFSLTSKAVFYIKHNIRNVYDDKERLQTKRNCIKRSEFTFEHQFFPLVFTYFEFLVRVFGSAAQNGCAVRKVTDLVLVLVVDASILYWLIEDKMQESTGAQLIVGLEAQLQEMS